MDLDRILIAAGAVSAFLGVGLGGWTCLAWAAIGA